MTRPNRNVGDVEARGSRGPGRLIARGAGRRAMANVTGRRIIGAIAVGLLALGLSGCIPPAPPLPPPSWRAEMLSDLNAWRGAHGLGPVAECGVLDLVAQRHSNNMAAFNYMGDNGPDGPLQSRVAAIGFNAAILGENVAAGQTSVSQVMGNWETDPPHNANLLGPYTLVGFGVASTGAGPYHYFWTQDFASPGGPC
jgi:hypothetical protein